MPSIEIGDLSPEERLRLIEQLWDSIAETPEAVPLTEAQRDEMDRRLDELDQEGPGGIPWAEVDQRIRNLPPRRRSVQDAFTLDV
jgi:putative addiction module component (TIGR02574 family)